MSQMISSPGRFTFGLLPEPEGRSTSFITSSIINAIILITVMIFGMTAHHVIVEHKYELTELVIPLKRSPEPKIKPEPKLPPPPERPKLQMQAPKIERPVPKPEPKPVEMEAKVALPAVKQEPAVVLAPQPKAALTAAMPAQNSSVKPSTAPVHLGDTFGVTPNPNATRPATVAAIGNPYGGMTGPSVAPHGVVGSAGIGDGLKAGSNAGVTGKVASAGIPGATSQSGHGVGVAGKVASAGIPAVTPQVAAAPAPVAEPVATSLEVLSKPAPAYTSEARQLKVQGDVVLRVTFLASGQIVVQGVVHGLGHGLDEEARRVAQQIHFRPATRNGQPVDLTTNIIITFQLA
jgi:TonB family protein